MFWACIIAFFVSVIIFGIPSKKNFENLEGAEFIFRSKWYWGTVLINGAFAIGVLILLKELQYSFKLGKREFDFAKDTMVYGLISGIFYPGIAYSIIALISTKDLQNSTDTEKIKSSMAFYVGLVGELISHDLQEILDKKVIADKERVAEAVDELEIAIEKIGWGWVELTDNLLRRIDDPESAGKIAEMVQAVTKANGEGEDSKLAMLNQKTEFLKIYEELFKKQRKAIFESDHNALLNDLENAN